VIPADTVYLDYAATTPVDPRIVDALPGWLAADGAFANPSSTHAAGRRAAALVSSAAEQVASLLGCAPGQLVWTSGATESDNLAILGAARYRAGRGRHLVTLPTEHKAVTDAFRQLEREGFDVTWLAPSPDGRLSLESLRQALRDDTQLVSVMHVNNETGVIQDIPAIADLCRERGVLLHVDAAQSFGKLPIDLAVWPVDFLSITAHKVYGPKGIGALYVSGRPGSHVAPLFHGGGQQGGLRPGTLPAHLIAAFGLAAGIAAESMRQDRAHLARLRSRFQDAIRGIPGLRHNSPDDGFPGIINVSAGDVDGESLMLALEPLCVASGSACNSARTEPSGVLRALGLDDAEAQGAIRFSFGRPTTTSEVDFAAAHYRAAVERLRDIAPGAAA